MSSETSTGLIGQGSSSSNRTGRVGDMSGVSGRSTTEDSRALPGSSMGRALTGGGSAWRGNIWGPSALGGAFAGSSNNNNNNNDGSGSGNRGPNSLEGKTGSGSLGPDNDPWSTSRPTPWNTTTTSPALPNAQLHQSGTSPIHHRNSNQGAPPHGMSEPRRSTSPYFEVRQPPIGQGSGPAKRPAKPYLDPTSSTFTTSQGPEDRSNVSGITPNMTLQSFYLDETAQRPFQSLSDQMSRDADSRRDFPAASFGSTSGATSFRADGVRSRGSQFGPPEVAAQYLNGAPFAQGSDQSSSFSQLRPGHSNNSSSISSQANSRHYESASRASQRDELTASLNRVTLNGAASEGANPHLQATIDTTSAPNHFASQSSFEYGFPGSQGTNLGQWGLEDTPFPNGVGSLIPDGLQDSQYLDQFGQFRGPSSPGQGNMTPARHDRRRSAHQNQWYSAGATPPTSAEQYHSGSRGSSAAGSRARQTPNGHPALLDQKLRGLQQEQQSFLGPQRNPVMPYRGPLANPYDLNQGGLRFNPLGSYLPVPGLVPGTVVPRGPAKDQEVGHSMRSPLLEEYRSSAKTSKRYELKDIYNHVCEFSGDQHGSRFIQLKLETANSDEKDQVFREIKPNSLQLMQDVFGNYVIQKFFEHGTQQQKTVLAEQMKGHIEKLSLQMYGCRVVQKALEHILVDQQASLVKELDANVLQCVRDQNGNHVIQKAIERVPKEHIQFIIKAFVGQVQSLAMHPYGCRVIQRMLEHCDADDQAFILRELHACAHTLIQDQYGNYVTQHIIEHGKEEDRDKVIKLIMNQLLHFSKHKFASNVVEKSIQFGTDKQRQEILTLLTTVGSNGSPPLQALMRDQYGNYVIQKMLGQMRGADYDKLVEQIKPQLAALKKYAYGKQINAIEKLISTSSNASQATTPPPDASAAPTPPLLTMDAQSPQSSSLPSANTSTCDGPVKSGASEEPTKEREARGQPVTIATNS